tara:strand:- start:332 stop:577 length:246 start_codon:yes stop_codon:yes gene_type:complete
MSKKHIWDNENTVKTFLKTFYVSCALLILVDFVIHRHGHISVEEWPGFYAVYGFIACVLLVFIAKHILRPLVMKEEDYYDH